MLKSFFPLKMCILVLNFVVLFLFTDILLYLILENQPNPYFLWQIDFSHFVCFLFFLYQHFPNTTHFLIISVWKEMISDHDSFS